MTNGENILSAFSNATIRRCKNKDFTYIEVEQNDKWIADFDMEWWNAEYKEPTTKNDLGVDTDKLIADCEKMSFDFELFGRPTKALLLDAVKNIVKDLPSVTQEPRKGEWLRMSDLSEQEDDRYKCSRCGNVIHHKNKMDLYTFNSWCGRCGSDNGRHINYEVEE